jgi:autotransporter-associated beta strand protein
LTKTTDGTVTLSGANTYDGPTTISNGTLRVDGSLGNTAVTVVGGGLELTSTNALSSATTLDIRSGAEVRLSFAGTNVIYSLTVNGEIKESRVYAAGSLPGLTGTAGAYLKTLSPPPKGTLVSFL